MKTRALGILAVATLVSVPVLAHWGAGEDGKVVDVEQVQSRQVRASILTSGTLVYEQQAMLSPEVIGRVRQVKVREGDRVEEGQVLLVLDDEMLHAEVDQQQAVVAQQGIAIERQRVELQAAKRQAERMAQLFKSQLIDARHYEQEQQAAQLAEIGLRTAQESLGQSRAQLQQSRQRLAKATIRAPMSGVVVAISIKEGETAVPSASGIAGSSLITIADRSRLRGRESGRTRTGESRPYRTHPAYGAAGSARLRAQLHGAPALRRGQQAYAAAGHVMPCRDLHPDRLRCRRRAATGSA